MVIASGRAFASLPADVLAVPGIEYAITSNGAAVYHVPTGRCLHRCLLTQASVAALLDTVRGAAVSLECFIEGVAYADAAYVRDPVSRGASEKAVPYIQRTRHPVENIVSFIRSNAHQLDAIDLVLSDSKARLQLHTHLQTVVPDIYITSSVPHLLEISHKDAGKHSGLRFLAELLHLSPSNIAAFGDGDNDVDMLTFAGCGVAVENASPACLTAADRVTAHHDDDGVAKTIHQLLT